MSKFTRKRDNVLNKAKNIAEDAKDYINNDFENDAKKILDNAEKTFNKAAGQTVEAVNVAAEQVERYVDKHLVDDLHSAGAAIEKAAGQTVEAVITAAEQVERYVDKHLVDDLHSAGAAIEKAVDQINDFAHCVETCSSNSEFVAQGSCMNSDSLDA